MQESVPNTLGSYINLQLARAIREDTFNPYTGKPAPFYDHTNPDWVPNIRMGSSSLLALQQVVIILGSAQGDYENPEVASVLPSVSSDADRFQCHLK